MGTQPQVAVARLKDGGHRVLRQAIEIKRDSEQNTVINKLMAQALVAAQKYEEAAQILQKLAEERKQKQTDPPKAEASGSGQSAPLPSKLIISAPKKLLDEVASGKMSFEEFKKAVSVEYLTFPPQKK